MGSMDEVLPKAIVDASQVTYQKKILVCMFERK